MDWNNFLYGFTHPISGAIGAFRALGRDDLGDTKKWTAQDWSNFGWSGVVPNYSDGVGNSGYGIDNQNATLDPTGYSQSAYAYENQLKLDELERNFNSAEAQKNRDWQEMMSNTSYQRAVKDLQASGLNPWLALNGGSFGGASTPSGAQASSSSGSASTPNPTIYKAYLQLLSSLASSAASVLKAKK